jgi:phospholipid/cholesterol/gamma-HCH transport system substrate-binding protein
VQKQAPSAPRILIMVAFALSCFGLLLYLWLAFGGTSPLSPQGYRVQVKFPEATLLAQEADVVMSGVPVGKVKAKELAPGGNATLATIELEPEFAPLARDARAMLRQKTILGQTYVELTRGHPKSAGTVPDGGTLSVRHVRESVELDELLSTFDPFTRKAYRTWQQSLSDAVRGRGQDLNDALGTLPRFVQSGGDLLEVLDDQRGALKALVRNTGVVFEALTQREDQLQALIRNADRVFSAISSQRESFAEIWRVFPTFLDESKATFGRLQRFATDTRPLVRDLRPAAENLGPALRAVGELSPDLRRLFLNYGPLIDAQKRSLPATRELLVGLRPLLGELGPWLGQVNPILEWIGVNSHTLTDMFANLGVATAAKTNSGDLESSGHYLRQFGPTGAETAAMHPNRLSSNRGNAYINPLALTGPELAASKIIGSFDCVNAGGEKKAGEGTPAQPACREQKPLAFQGRLQPRFPHVDASEYK